MTGKLFLIPSTLGEASSIETLAPATLAILRGLENLVVESPKQARRFLKSSGFRLTERSVRFCVLDEHTSDDKLPELLAPVFNGSDLGILSDAGCPAIADPGARLVRLAHQGGIQVLPLVGPSSITLALMGSGLNGQRFAFHGYLPVEAQSRARALRSLEIAARTYDQTQIWIEAPYRNNQLLAAILRTCAPNSILCVAADLTLPSQYIRTRSIAEWRCDCPNIDRRPAVFLLSA